MPRTRPSEMLTRPSVGRPSRDDVPSSAAQRRPVYGRRHAQPPPRPPATPLGPRNTMAEERTARRA
jgi:hypothetical protein